MATASMSSGSPSRTWRSSPSPSPTRTRRAARKRNDSGVKNAYADYRTMLETRSSLHIVSVADRWLDQHRDMVVACARAGASVFLEKPMARTLAEADEMIAECEMRHVKLAIAHQTRYSPRARVIRDFLGEGKLGEVLELHGRGKEDARGGGQDLMVLGTHLFDLMRFFAGDAQWCHARIRQKGKPSVKADVTDGGEGMGPVIGDQINATYGFTGPRGSRPPSARPGTAPARSRVSAWKSAAPRGSFN